MRSLLIFTLVCGAIVSGATLASAGGPEPGSLLLYPIFDSSPGVATVFTVTNTNADPQTGAVYVHFYYIDGTTCQESNRVERLTPNDTFTCIASAHNPQQSFGYLYLVATDGSRPITFNYLVGQLVTVDGIEGVEYGMNAWSFQGMTAYRTGTDLDADGIRDLDGLEYEQAPDQHFVTRFFGQGGPFESELVLVNLTGGTQFRSTIDFLVYNDNEQVFSAETSFTCWTRRFLLDVSGIFSQVFLDWSIDDLEELYGMPSIETGWIRLDGSIATSPTKSIDDPAFLAALIERVGSYGAADLPFGGGTQANGDLLPRSVNGDR
ncbi:MAG: hypothetical protein AB1486_22545 [Planctomycetota bacterium]